MDPTLVAAVLGTVSSLIGALLASLGKRRQQKERKSTQLRLRDQLAKLEVSAGIGPIRVSRTLVDEAVVTDLTERIEKQIVDRLSADPRMTVDEVRSAVQTELGEVRQRIEKIENRFPPESQLERISSINDALLSERIDQIGKRIESLEKQVLSRWDVAKTVSTVIGGVCAVVAATYSVMKVLAP